MKEQLIKGYKIYKEHFSILAPVVAFDASVLIFIPSIPYLNLYARYIMLIVLFANWFVISWTYKFTFNTVLKSLLLLGVVCYLLLLINVEYFAEVFADTIFLILLYSIVKEFYSLYVSKDS